MTTKPSTTSALYRAPERSPTRASAATDRSRRLRVARTFRLSVGADCPYKHDMHGIVELPLYLADAKSAGVSDDERDLIAAVIAADPEAGDLIPGTGGARKVRIAGKGKGKSGGYRVITYYAATDVPVFLLRLVSKGQRADISKAERNDVRLALETIAADYRASVREEAERLRG